MLRHVHHNLGMTWSDGCKKRTKMYLKDSTEVSREQIYVVDQATDFIFRSVSERRRADHAPFQYSPMHIVHFHNIYRYLNRWLFSFKDDKVFWKYFYPSFEG